jgi:hypothetical protein
MSKPNVPQLIEDYIFKMREAGLGKRVTLLRCLINVLQLVYHVRARGDEDEGVNWGPVGGPVRRLAVRSLGRLRCVLKRERNRYGVRERQQARKFVMPVRECECFF